jgi:DNA-binding NtrC family response regulator
MNKNKYAALIVDDEPDMCWALEHILNKNGYAAKSVLSGEKAISCVKEKHFPLVFLDAKLSDMEGLDLAARIREIDPVSHIVIISGYFYSDDMDILEAMGNRLIHGFIAKPFDHKEIARVIEKCL